MINDGANTIILYQQMERRAYACYVQAKFYTNRVLWHKTDEIICGSTYLLLNGVEGR